MIKVTVRNQFGVAKSYIEEVNDFSYQAVNNEGTPFSLSIPSLTSSISIAVVDDFLVNVKKGSTVIVEDTEATGDEGLIASLELQDISILKTKGVVELTCSRHALEQEMDYAGAFVDEGTLISQYKDFWDVPFETTDVNKTAVSFFSESKADFIKAIAWNYSQLRNISLMPFSRTGTVGAFALSSGVALFRNYKETDTPATTREGATPVYKCEFDDIEEYNIEASQPAVTHLTSFAYFLKQRPASADIASFPYPNATQDQENPPVKDRSYMITLVEDSLTGLFTTYKNGSTEIKRFQTNANQDREVSVSIIGLGRGFYISATASELQAKTFGGSVMSSVSLSGWGVGSVAELLSDFFDQEGHIVGNEIVYAFAKFYTSGGNTLWGYAVNEDGTGLKLLTVSGDYSSKVPSKGRAVYDNRLYVPFISEASTYDKVTVSTLIYNPATNSTSVSTAPELIVGGMWYRTGTAIATDIAITTDDTGVVALVLISDWRTDTSSIGSKGVAMDSELLKWKMYNNTIENIRSITPWTLSPVIANNTLDPVVMVSTMMDNSNFYDSKGAMQLSKGYSRDVADRPYFTYTACRYYPICYIYFSKIGLFFYSKHMNEAKFYSGIFKSVNSPTTLVKLPARRIANGDRNNADMKFKTGEVLQKDLPDLASKATDKITLSLKQFYCYNFETSKWELFDVNKFNMPAVNSFIQVQLEESGSYNLVKITSVSVKYDGAFRLSISGLVVR